MLRHGRPLTMSEAHINQLAFKAIERAYEALIAANNEGLDTYSFATAMKMLDALKVLEEVLEPIQDAKIAAIGKNPIDI